MNQRTNCTEDVSTKLQDDNHTENTSADVHGGKSSSRREYLMLPPLLPEHKGRATLVLDIDGTILAENSVQENNVDFVLQQESTATRTFITKRPYLQEFLEMLSAIYEIVIFTETSKTKADAILDYILGGNAHYITHRLYRDSCTEMDGKLVKDVSFLGRDIRKVVIVDDCIFRYSLQPCNAISITRFDGYSGDKELIHLYDLLVLLSTEEDVRVSLATAFPELHDFESGIPKQLDNHTARTGVLSSRLGSFLRSDLRYRGIKHTLVLDMDDTLLKESWKKLPAAGSDYFTVFIDSELETYSLDELESTSDSDSVSDSDSQSDSESLITGYVYRRPGLKKFLREMSKVFQILIFTMSIADRAAVLLDEINYEKCITMYLARDCCSEIDGQSFKELRLLGLDMKKVVFIDDLPLMCELYPSNSIAIKAFDGDKSDRELTKLIPFLRKLSELEDVRPAIQARHDLPVRAIEPEDN